MNCIVCNEPLFVGKIIKNIEGEDDLKEVIILDKHMRCKSSYEKNKIHIYKWRENNKEKLNEKHKKYSNDYYHRNKEIIKKKALERYHKKKLEKQVSELTENLELSDITEFSEKPENTWEPEL